tara:strand:- start:1177 stop:1902 length:726 start_codon:yes stop_codon:yes gene_type:complete
MKNYLKFISLFVLTSFFILSCDCDCEDESQKSKYSPEDKSGNFTGSPGAANLTAPANNNDCLIGSSVDAFTSNVTFRWSASNDTDSYDLSYTNLSTNETLTKTNIKSTSTTILLFKGHQYAWNVRSIKSNSNKTTSATNKFYLAGNSILTKVPFAAVLNTAVISGSKTTLSWSGSDPDAGDVLSYTLYVDKIDGKQSPISSGLSLSSKDLTLDPGSTYYWRVKTTDQTNNSSFSTISTFSL